MSSEEPSRLVQYENDNLVAALLRQWLACAVDWMSEAGLSKKADLILREMEKHLGSISPDTPGVAGTLSLIYGMMIARREENQDWCTVVELGHKVLAVPGLSLAAVELNSFSLGRALCMLGRTDEAIEVYVDGVRRAREAALWPGVPALLLEFSNVAHLASAECISRASDSLRQWVASDPSESLAFEDAVREARLADWARGLALRLRPSLEDSRRDLRGSRESAAEETGEVGT